MGVAGGPCKGVWAETRLEDARGFCVSGFCSVQTTTNNPYDFIVKEADFACETSQAAARVESG